MSTFDFNSWLYGLDLGVGAGAILALIVFWLAGDKP